MGISAMAQTDEINAVKFEQGQTTDRYMLSTKPKVTFDKDFNPVINNTTTYDLALGKVRTTFEIISDETNLIMHSDGDADKLKGGKIMKVLQDGVFMIIREDNRYTITGVEE